MATHRLHSNDYPGDFDGTGRGITSWKEDESIDFLNAFPSPRTRVLFSRSLERDGGDDDWKAQRLVDPAELRCTAWIAPGVIQSRNSVQPPDLLG